MGETVSVGLLGLGTVGSGVVQMITDHQKELQQRIGCPVEVRKILVQDMEKERDVQVDSSLLTKDADDIIFDSDIDVVIEAIGGIEKAQSLILKALNNKKHVVTANKDLMALNGGELLSAARENDCDLFYEASVAGGIPILRSLVEGLSSDRITKMMGIVNGTTNYILTKMSKNKLSFEDVLKKAQELGFAEADPTSDIEGLDAARKMVILSTLGYSMKFGLEDVDVEGITRVSEEDIAYSKRLGYTMKLIGLAKADNGSVEISVQPTLLPNEHPLSSVNDEYNAVYVYGEAVGETMFYGPGAGQLPTATAVVADLVAVIKNMRLGVNGKSVILPQNEKKLKTAEDIDSKYFLRMIVKDEAGAFSVITNLFKEQGISLEKLIQEPLVNQKQAEVVIVTHKTNQKAYEETYNRLRDLDVVVEVKSRYRVEEV
ncbi:homoserine dehydrogenase [Pseudalkalibacillus caeni]|uniref:Homoserine dehydrogenase n=1 Tax=Exobacillus caeni TaxID=2574798 RepID=A0A5R9F946_9BACL|nr:homoserine dehydrogenase [Pseudalkalibacillus caeni]TLS38836.1 homoserine dehydrogenase [Pseudalkalibacillus caeni]